MPESKFSPEFRAAVGLSKEWDAREAGREVAEKCIANLKGEAKITFVFSTIHYEKNFKELLRGITEIIPSPLVGCTGSSILTPDEIMVHGVGILSLSGEMDVSTDVEKNIRRDSERKGERLGKRLLEDMNVSEYKNKVIFMFPSGPIIPPLPYVQRLMRTGLMARLFPIMKGLFAVTGTGPGREEYILKGLVKGSNGEIPIIGGSSADDYKYTRNFQFLDNKAYKNSVVAVGLCSNIKFGFGAEHGLKPTGETVRVTKSRGNVIFELDNKPAWKRLVEIHDIPKSLEEKWRTAYPLFGSYKSLGEKVGDIYNIWRPCHVASNAIFFMRDIKEGTTLQVCEGSGKELVLAAKEAVELAIGDMKNPLFAIVFSCASREMKVHEKIDEERKYLKEVLSDTPFLGYYVFGQELYQPPDEPAFMYETIDICVGGSD